MRGWYYWGGWGRGRRRWCWVLGMPGWAYWHCPPPWAVPLTREERVEILREWAEWLQKQLELVNQRLADLEKAAGEPSR